MVEPDMSYITWVDEILTAGKDYVSANLATVVDVIEELLNNPEKAKQVAERGYAIARDHLTRERSLALAAQLIRKHAKRD